MPEPAVPVIIIAFNPKQFHLLEYIKLHFRNMSLILSFIVQTILILKPHEYCLMRDQTKLLAIYSFLVLNTGIILAIMVPNLCVTKYRIHSFSI